MTDRLSGSPNQVDDVLIASIQSILLSQDRDRLRQIERQVAAIRSVHESQTQALRQQVGDLLSAIDAAQQTARNSQESARDLQVEVELLRRKAQSDSKD